MISNEIIVFIVEELRMNHKIYGNLPSESDDKVRVPERVLNTIRTYTST